MSLSVNDFTIDNASGQAVRLDIQACFKALQGQSAETTDLPSSKCVAGMTFLNTTSKILKVRNSTNGAFTEIGSIDEANLGLLPRSGGSSAPMTGQFLADDSNSPSAPAISFDTNTNTGIYRVNTDILGISCGGGTSTTPALANFEFSDSSFISREDITLQKTDASDAFLEIRTTGNSNDAYVDLTTDNSAVGQDFGFRFLRQAGATGNSYLHHRSDSQDSNGNSNAGSLFILSQGGTNGSIIFSTGGTPHITPSSDQPATERWRINPTGCLNSNGVGTSNALTSAGAFFNVQNTNFEGLALIKNNAGWNTPLFINNTHTTTYSSSNWQNYVVFAKPASNAAGYAQLGEIRGNGTDVYFHGQLDTTSDYRLKENITSLTDAITRFKKLKPSRFNFISNKEQTIDGFIAHEVEEAVPEAVIGTKDEVELEDDDSRGVKKGDPVYQGINPPRLLPLVVAALQEAVAKIETLETKVAALESS